MCFILGLFWWVEEHQGGSRQKRAVVALGENSVFAIPRLIFYLYLSFFWTFDISVICFLWLQDPFNPLIHFETVTLFCWQSFSAKPFSWILLAMLQWRKAKGNVNVVFWLFGCKKIPFGSVSFAWELLVLVNEAIAQKLTQGPETWKMSSSSITTFF